MQGPKKIIISRTDSIGDVVLTLPMCGLIKKYFPETKIVFLGNTYTLPIVKCSQFVDEVMDYWEIKNLKQLEQINYFKSLNANCAIHVFPQKKIAELLKKARIPQRIGTNRRFYHWFTCNKLINLRRRNSNLHEAQLNIKLLKGIGIVDDIVLSEIPKYYGISAPEPSDYVKSLIDTKRFNVILHPKSKGSAREWGLQNFARLINALPNHRFNILIAGTEYEGELFRKELVAPFPDKVFDVSGKLSLSDYISLISVSDGLIAASTGPLHIAAALGIRAIGLYAPMRPIFPTRWAPLGKNAHVLVKGKNCNDCKKDEACYCVQEIEVEEVLNLLMK